MTEYGRIHTDGSRFGGQPTQADIDAAESIFWVETTIDDHEAVAKAFARHRQYGYDQGYYDGQRDRPPTQSDALRVTDEMVERARQCAKEHTDEDIDWREILTAALGQSK